MTISALAFIPPTKFKGPVFQQEMMAAVAARFSRNKEGLDKIVELCEKVKNPKKVFDFIDYGHASVQDLAGMIPVVFEDEAMSVMMKIFEHMYVYSAQESSTRYIDFNGANCLTAGEIGIKSKEAKDLYDEMIVESMRIYNNVKTLKEKEFDEQGFFDNIKVSDKKEIKRLERFKRNQVFDSIRYYLPVTAKTSAIIMATPREWSQLIKILLSFDMKVFNRVANEICGEVVKIAPNLIRHVEPDFISKLSYKRRMGQECGGIMFKSPSVDCVGWNAGLLSCLTTIPKGDVARLTEWRDNRYDVLDPELDSIPVEYAFNGVTVAEARDINRMRSGGRTFVYDMQGLYLPEVKGMIFNFKLKRIYKKLNTMLAMENLHWFGMLLGTQMSIKRTNTLRKTMYAVELRTGSGAHPGYAKYYEKLGGMISNEYGAKMLIGSAEPEMI